jgi:FeS assembly protein IscX
MQPKLTWTQVHDIGFELFEAEPQLDPLTLRFTELIEKVMALPGFEGERDKCNEKILEAIQMAWLEEFQDED